MYIPRIWSAYTHDIQYICVCTHLDISSLKLMTVHVEWVTPGAHNPAIGIWLELYWLEGVNVDSTRVRHDAGLQNSIECGRTPGSWLVRSWRHIQLRSIVICNPLSQFLGKKLQQGMAATVHVLNRRTLPSRICCLSRHAEMLLLQEHNVETWDWVKSWTKQILQFMYSIYKAYT